MHIIIEILGLLCYLLYCYVEAFVKLFLPKSRKDVRGDVVLVTGAGHGIGREIALEFGRLGAKVVVWDISKDWNDATADEIKRNGGSAFAYICDVTKHDDIRKTADQLRKDVGDVDILVNNAGVLNGGELLKLQEKHIRRTFDINIMAHFWTVQAFLPAMLEKNKGHIVTIASMAGKAGFEFLVDYCASKYAAVGFAESLKEEIEGLGKHGVKSSVVCPVFVDTGLCKHIRFRFGKVLSPKEVALTIVDKTLKDVFFVPVPSQLWINVRLAALWPEKFVAYMRKFMDSGIDPQYDPAALKMD